MKRVTTGQKTDSRGVSAVYEAVARSAGWIAEKEYNGEDDGVRNPFNGDWAETWRAAVEQIVEGYLVASGRQAA